jgi:hypothetical protein
MLCASFWQYSLPILGEHLRACGYLVWVIRKGTLHA